MRGSNFMICVTANYEIECEGPAAVEESVVEGFWKISDVHIDARGGAWREKKGCVVVEE